MSKTVVGPPILVHNILAHEEEAKAADKNLDTEPAKPALVTESACRLHWDTALQTRLAGAATLVGRSKHPDVPTPPQVILVPEIAYHSSCRRGVVASPQCFKVLPRRL